MKPKPSGLGPEYAAQFEDDSVARAYAFRVPYPPEVFAFLGSLQPDGPGRVLELGCGSGDLTIGLAPHTNSIDAVDPSDALLVVARRRQGDSTSRINWHACSAESFPYRGPYSLVVAAQSLHWMDWAVVLPNIASSVRPDGWLAVVGRSGETPLRSELRSVIPRYSTNQDFEPYDLVQHLTACSTRLDARTSVAMSFDNPSTSSSSQSTPRTASLATECPTSPPMPSTEK